MQGFNMGRYIPPSETDNPYAKPYKNKNSQSSRTGTSKPAQTIRFECPFAIWCTTCPPEQQIIGQGVRFNAEKKKVGNYHSTPVWSFRFKHTVCGGWIEVRTDPRNAEYVVVEGARRKAQRESGSAGDDEEEIGVGSVAGREEREKSGMMEKEGGFGAVEKKVVDKQLLMGQGRRLEALEASSRRDWDDPYERSRLLRSQFRVERKSRKEGEQKGERLREKFGLSVEIVEENEEDVRRARLVQFGPVPTDDNDTGHKGRKRGLFEQIIVPSAGHGNGISEGSSTATRKKTNPETKTDAEKTATSLLLPPHTQKKSSLAKEIQSNTRAVIDPFGFSTDHHYYHHHLQNRSSSSSAKKQTWTMTTTTLKRKRAQSEGHQHHLQREQRQSQRERGGEGGVGVGMNEEKQNQPAIKKHLVEYDSDSLYHPSSVTLRGTIYYYLEALHKLHHHHHHHHHHDTNFPKTVRSLKPPQNPPSLPSPQQSSDVFVLFIW